MTGRLCGTCGGPVHDHGHLCTGCTGATTLLLQRLGGWRTDGRWVPGLLADLITAGTGAARIPSQGGGTDQDGHTLDSRYEATCSTAGQPGNPAAMTLHAEIRTNLLGWCRTLNGDQPADVPNPAHWLELRMPAIRRHDWAPTLLADLERHVTRAEALVDLPDAITVPCPWCKRRVPIDPDAEIITCRCGCWGVLDWWIDQVAPPLPTEPLTLAELPDWLRTRGYDVTHKQLRNWADRGRLPCLLGRGDADARLYSARTALEAAEQSRARRVIPSTMTP